MNNKTASKFKMPANEDARIAALRSLDILDTQPETIFDDLVQLAAEVTGSPISVLSLIDIDRQWLKAKTGLDVSETPRDISFCTHTILNQRGQAFIVTDATADARFSNNPLVTAGIEVRYYAGFPLVLFGEYAVGSLCVIDRESKQLNEFQLATLSKLADIAVARLEALSPEFQSAALRAYFR